MTLPARVLCTALATGLLAAGPLAAQDLDTPEGDVILTISGAIENTNGDGTARFDMDMLEGMEPVTFETTTIWTDGVQTFTGVPLADLMETVGATGQNLSATAVNDYTIEIPRDDWAQDGPIIAYLNNGEPMSVRDKGPLWVVYPYDSDPAYQTQVVYSRSIWQLDRIIVED